MKLLATVIISLTAALVHGRTVELHTNGRDTKVVDPNTDVHFLLWTRSNRDAAYELKLDDPANLEGSPYDSSLPTKIFAHGFTMDGRDEKVINMKNEFLNKEACNFISVDWGVLAVGPDYFAAVAHVPIVGSHTGDLINYLVSHGSLTSRFHLIGFSLGAHVVGKAGAGVSSSKVARITGLDPAFPDFSLSNTDTRLDTTDGQFVDIIHTNSGNLLEGALSFEAPIGHVDFYPNGGNSQPGCGLSTKADIIDLVNGCSHGRAPIYFTESINSATKFRAVQCDNNDDYLNGLCSGNPVANMGLPASTTARGVYYLETHSQEPFAMG